MLRPSAYAAIRPYSMPLLDHLHEVPRPGGSAVQEAPLARLERSFAARRPRRRVDAGGERGEDRLEAADGIRIATDHQRVAALEAPDATARADVDVLEAALRHPRRAPKVVAVVRVAAVDYDVAVLRQRNEQVERVVHDRGWHREPNRSRRLELVDGVLERVRAHRAFS